MTLNHAPDSFILSDDRLATELARLEIPFVSSSTSEESSLLPEQLLLQGLALSSNARLRMALIPLFLARPNYGQTLTDQVIPLSDQARITLICYYTAAMLLQRKYKERLSALGVANGILPDLFGRELHLPPVDHVDTMLVALAERHAELSGRALNWYGTYEQAVRRFIQRLEWENKWTAS